MREVTTAVYAQKVTTCNYACVSGTFDVFSVVVASNTNELPNQNPTQSNNLQSSFMNESEGETFTVTVDGTNLRFSPDTIIIKEGDTVRFLWENQLLPHNAVERNGVFDSGDPERNVDYTYTFNVTENGTYEYVCEPHETWE